MSTPNALAMRESLNQKYRTARANLLLMIAFTALNIVLLLTGSDTMMLFSATVPYFTAVLAVMSPEYTVDYGSEVAGVMLTVAIAATTVIILLYILCWWLSKKRVGFMITALVMFLLDSAFLAFLYISEPDSSGIIDALIHVWVLYYLFTGVSSGLKLKKLSQEDDSILEDIADTAETDTAESSASVGLYPADESVKSRILAEADAAGHHIVYRRVKRTNELVIDGYVYDTYEALLEQPHTLCATLNGTVIESGTNAASRIFINVDGETVVKKLRLV